MCSKEGAVHPRFHAKYLKMPDRPVDMCFGMAAGRLPGTGFPARESSESQRIPALTNQHYRAWPPMYPPLDCFFGEYGDDTYPICVQAEEGDPVPWTLAWSPAWLADLPTDVSTRTRRTRSLTQPTATSLPFIWPRADTRQSPHAAFVTFASLQTPAPLPAPAVVLPISAAALLLTPAFSVQPISVVSASPSSPPASHARSPPKLSSTRAQLKQLELHTASARPFGIDVGGCLAVFNSAQAAMCAQQMLCLRGGARPDLVWKFAADKLPPGQAALERVMLTLARSEGVAVDAAAWKAAEYSAARKALHARARVDDRFAATCARLVRARAIPKHMKFAGIYRNIGRSRRATCLLYEYE